MANGKVYKSIAEIPTIDVNLVTIAIDTGVADTTFKGTFATDAELPTGSADGDWAKVTSTKTEWSYDGTAWKNTRMPIGTRLETEEDEFGFDTSTQIGVEPQTETEDAVKLMIKGKLRSQKLEKVTITGNTITLTDNVFNPELVTAIQGGTILFDETGDEVAGYVPPEAGSDEVGEIFRLKAYSAQYTSAGIIKRYERIIYPNCKGNPISMSTEDNTFRAPEYTIQSAADEKEPPFLISYVKDLPILEDRP